MLIATLTARVRAHALGHVLVSAFALGACASSMQPSAAQRATLLVRRHENAEARAVLLAYLAKHPRAVPERKLLIRVLGAIGDLRAAEGQAHELAAVVAKGSPVPDVELGHAYELSHHYDEALAFYDRAAALAPRDPEGPREGGLRTAHWGELELARPRLEEALRRNPRDARVWHVLGLVRVRLGDVEGARAAYRAGLTADPNALENRIGLATIALMQGEAAEALRQYELIVRARPRLGDAELGRSWALIRLGRLREAEQALERAAALHADPRALKAQARLLAHLRTWPSDGSAAEPRTPQGNHGIH